MTTPAFIVHGAAPGSAPGATSPLVLDSPHSGFAMPADFGSIRTEAELRDGEDCFIDALWQPASARGVPLLAAQIARTYLDPNRHAGDIDLALLSEPWPQAHVPSGKAAIGKALLWRTLDDQRPLYDRKLSVAEVLRRIAHVHTPYHAQLKQLLDAAHARFGVVFHINCHSMNPVSGALGNTGDGRDAGAPRADIVLGDRDGTTCAPAFTAFVRDFLAARGYSVKINDPFKGVELVRAFSNPAAGRHSLQIEVNKRVYMDMDMDKDTAMDTANPTRHAGFATLQGHLMALVDALDLRVRQEATA